MWDKRASIAAVHDGDTITAVLDQGFWQTTTITVRLLGVFAPELKQVGGPETRKFVLDWVQAQMTGAWPFIVTTARGPRSDKEETTLGRYLCTVTSADGKHNLNTEVQAWITAQGYPGGTGS